MTVPAQTPAAGGMDDYSISLARANLLGVPIFIVLAALVVVPYGLAWGWVRLFLAFNEFMNWQRFVPAIVLGTIAHEGLHGLGWKFFGRIPLASIKYGFNPRTVTPYAHCTVPLRASAYKAGTMLPGLALGVLPGLFGIAAQNGFWTIFAAFFLGAASGDILCLWMMRTIPSDARVIDHPRIIEQEENSHEKQRRPEDDFTAVP